MKMEIEMKKKGSRIENRIKRNNIITAKSSARHDTTYSYYFFFLSNPPSLTPFCPVPSPPLRVRSVRTSVHFSFPYSSFHPSPASDYFLTSPLTRLHSSRSLSPTPSCLRYATLALLTSLPSQHSLDHARLDQSER